MIEIFAEFVMNPAGKSFVCILHEFVQHAERVQPKYTFQELGNKLEVLSLLTNLYCHNEC